MLTIIAKRRAGKSKKRAYKLITEGLDKVNAKLYKQAMLCFGEAVDLDSDAVLPALRNQFDKFYQNRDYDSALSCGMAVFKICKTDPELANQLGNCARHQENYKRANNMYRFALKIDRHYKEAFFNLAASMGKVNLFDLDVGVKIKQFLGQDHFIFPEYLETPEFIDLIKKQLAQSYEEQQTFLQESLFFDYSESSELAVGPETQYPKKGKENKVNQVPYQPSAEEVIHYIRKDLIESSENGSSPDVIRYQMLLYNLGLFALTEGLLEDAFNCFEELSEKSRKYEYVGMLIAITDYQLGRKSKAIEQFIQLLGKDRYNRFYNTNLGIIYKKENNRLLATKYLAVAAFLLEKSGGVYKTSDILEQAHQAFDAGDLKKAYQLYRVVVSESDHVEATLKIGDIFFAKKIFNKAADQYKKALIFDPQSVSARNRIESAFQHFYQDAFKLHHCNKFVNAVDGFEKALIFKDDIDCVKAAFDIYSHLKRHDKAKGYETRYLDMLKEEKEKALQKEQLQFLKKGKIYLKAKCFNDAIEAFEEAFKRKADKDVFMYLAHLYKNLRRKAELENLLSRWNHIREMEEREKIEKRIKEQQKKAQSIYS